MGSLDFFFCSSQSAVARAGGAHTLTEQVAVQSRADKQQDSEGPGGIHITADIVDACQVSVPRGR